MRLHLFFINIMLIFTFLLTGCNKTSRDNSITNNVSSDSTLSSTQESLPYKDGSELIPSPASSFAEDLKFYNIMPLEELNSIENNDSNDSQQNINQAIIRKARSDDRSDDQDDNSDEDEKKQNDADNEKNSDQNNNSDDGGDDDSGSSDDGDDDSSSSSSSSSHQTGHSVEDYTVLGSCRIDLNAKIYKFIIASDNYKRVANFSPYIVQNEDNSYTLFIRGYVIEDNQILYDKGIFTLKVNLPSLNMSGDLPILSNVLTNSAENQPVIGHVVIESFRDNIHEFKVGITVDEFIVLDKTKTYGFKSNFDLGFSTAGFKN